MRDLALPLAPRLALAALAALPLAAGCPQTVVPALDAGQTDTGRPNGTDAAPTDQGLLDSGGGTPDATSRLDAQTADLATAPDVAGPADAAGSPDTTAASDVLSPQDAAADAGSGFSDAASDGGSAGADAAGDAGSSASDAALEDAAGVACALPDADSTQVFDFASGSYSASELNGSTHFIRTVFSLDIPDQMARVGDGLRLVFDAAALPAGVYLDYSHRSELRETDNTAYPAAGSTQIYRLVFSVESDLDPRQGPGTIVQRFNRDVDGPDCEVELTGVGQFSGDDDTPYVQTVCFGQRVRHPGVYLQPRNELLMAVANGLSDGAFGIWLNGHKLDGRSGIDTLPSTSGTWLQFGLYEHGLIYDNADRRAAQVASGSARASYVYHRFEKRSYARRLDLATLPSYDPNAAGYRCR